MLGKDLESSIGVENALNHWAISPAPKKTFFKKMYVYMYVCHMCAAAQSGQKVLDLEELELHVVVSCQTWVLGTEFLKEPSTLLTAEPSLQTP